MGDIGATAIFPQWPCKDATSSCFRTGNGFVCLAGTRQSLRVKHKYQLLAA